MTTYATLRSANDARHAEWDKDDVSGHSFYTTELAGEMGEMLDACYILGNQDTMAEELADTAICLDLVARRFDVELKIPFRTANDPRPSVNLVTPLCLAAAVGRACNTVKKLEREELGMVGSRATPDDLKDDLDSAAFYLAEIARSFDVDLEWAIAHKFNKTSDKYGLTTKMDCPA